MSRFIFFQSSKGVTLIELLVMISIIFAISLFSVPFYSRSLTQNAVINTEDYLISALRKAQLYSMIGKQNGIWGVYSGTGEIIFFQGNSFGTRDQAFDERFELNSQVTVSGFSEITFTKITGLPSSTPSTPTITISDAVSTETLQINSQGVVDKL